MSANSAMNDHILNSLLEFLLSVRQVEAVPLHIWKRGEGEGAVVPIPRTAEGVDAQT